MEENNLSVEKVACVCPNTNEDLRAFAKKITVEAENSSKEVVASENEAGEREENVERVTEKQREVEIERDSVKQLMESYLQSVAATERLKVELENIKKQSSADEIFKNSDYVQKASENENVEKLVIEKYLKKIAGGGSVEVLGSNTGTIAAASVRIPETLKEAKRIADAMMRN